MTDIFVNDVRANDNASLSLIPRIATFEELKQWFGLDVDTSKGEERAANGQRYWRIVGFEVRTGIAAFMPQVKRLSGDPAPDILVFRHFPGSVGFPASIDPEYFTSGEAGFTDSNGVKGIPYGDGNVTGENGGVDHIWLSSDPPGGKRIGSDMASRLGWIGGTDHLTANPIFRDTLKGDTTIPPAGDSRLVVYDKQGIEVGYTALISGGGTSGRIALVTDGQELAYVRLE